MKSVKGLLNRVGGACGGILFAALVFVSPALGETLWEPGFSGYISPKASVEVGDVLLVEIQPRTELSLESSHIDSENVRLTFSGGEGGGLFDFLPEGSSSSERELEEEDSYSLETRMAVQITGIEGNGLASVRGERSVEINGLREEILLTGKISPSTIRGSAEAVPFDRLLNAELSYSGVGYGMEPVLGAEDLEKRGAGEEETAGEEAAQEEAEELPGEGEEPPQEQQGQDQGLEAQAQGPEEAEDLQAPENGTPAGSEGYSLSDERREELLIEYINRFIDVLFSR